MYARMGATAGGVAGVLVGACDAALVLWDTGAFWVRPLALLEAPAVYGLGGSLAGALLGLALRTLTPNGAFRAALVGVATLGLAALAGFHLFDVGLRPGFRAEPLPYLGALAAAIAVGGLLWLATRPLVSGRPASAGARAALALGFLSLVAAALLAARQWRALGEFPALASEAAAGAPDIVLVVLDTTRRDGLSVYGNPRGTTPQLDAIAREGLIFSRAYAPSSWTSPSHASLFTGTLPSTHGTFFTRTALGQELPTLAEALAGRGYQTGFVSSKELLLRADGWTRGFRTAVSFNVEDRVAFVHRRLLARFAGLGTNTPLEVEMALRWMQGAQRADAPFLLFLNLNDPHVPYLPREPFHSGYLGELEPDAVDEARVRALASSQDPRERAAGLPQADLAALRARYDSEVAHMDAALGRLFAWLRGAHRERPLVLIVTSDHGELLGEHDLFYHNQYPYQELVHVPFLLWSDPPLGRGVSDGLVSLIDVFPTLVHLAGGDPARYPHLEGRRLLVDAPPEIVFAEHWSRASRDAPTLSTKAAIGEGAKLVWRSSGEATLYDLERDPGEQRDARAALPGEDTRLEAALRAAFDLDATTPAELPALDEATRRHLEALGYLPR